MSEIKLIILEWDGLYNQHRSLRTFEYNGVIYHKGNHVPNFVVDLMKSDEATKREMIKQIEESLK